jgi:ketosteroid isomerase-like protein
MNELADRIEIQELTARYNRAADDGDADALVAVFTPDGAMTMSSAGQQRAFRGAADLHAMLGGRPPGITVHATTDSIVELDGDEARQQCTLLLIRRLHDAGKASFRTGRYEDRLVRTPDGWKFAERAVTIDGENEAFMTLVAR